MAPKRKPLKSQKPGIQAKAKAKPKAKTKPVGKRTPPLVPMQMPPGGAMPGGVGGLMSLLGGGR